MIALSFRFELNRLPIQIMVTGVIDLNPRVDVTLIKPPKLILLLILMCQRSLVLCHAIPVAFPNRGNLSLQEIHFLLQFIYFLFVLYFADRRNLELIVRLF
jgi:hypothetical protein